MRLIPSPQTISTCLTFLTILPEKSNIDLPTPTEYIKKKKDRKEFKKHRKEWMENMHRSAPDTDWSKMDAESRKLQTKLVNLKRQELKLNGLWRLFYICTTNKL